MLCLKMKKELKLFVVQKYIFATSVQEAVNLDKVKTVDECYVDSDWKKENMSKKTGEMGFVNK